MTSNVPAISCKVRLPLDDGPQERLRQLDGWRAVSVLLVIVHHVAGFQHKRFLSHFPSLVHIVTYFGPLGVKVFFVISGFVICRLLISEHLRYGSVSVKAFYYRRALRILPPLCMYLVTMVLLLYLGLIHDQKTALLSAALFLYDTRLAPKGWFVGHTWSLAVEEQFYLIFPALWVLTPKAWTTRIILAFFFLCAAWNVSLAYTNWDSFTVTNARAGFGCICCGVLMALHEKRVRSLASKVPAFIAGLIAIALLVHPVAPDGWQPALYESLLVPPAIALVLLFSLDCRGWLPAVLCSKPLQAVGLTSYTIYLWQQLFLAPKTYYSSAGQLVPLFLPVLCLIVPLSYFLLEKPAMRYGKLLSRRVRKGPIDVKAVA